jgi:sulfatase maturation enzyme AslB (radical SAM superfamily)
MEPGATPHTVLTALRDASSEWVCSGDEDDPDLVPPPDDRSLGSQLARHAASVLMAGGSPPEALDSTLVRMLFTGESEALRARPGGDPDIDPAGVRPLAESMSSYPEHVLGSAPVRPKVLRNRSANIQLMTTRRCQLRCGYCPVIKGDEDMGRDVIDRAVHLLMTSTRDDLRLDFTGGEPLLRFEEVQRAAVRTIAAAEALGKSVRFYMVTNGFELSRHRAEELASYGFRVELSLDGGEEAHNRYKIPVDAGDNPYRRTVAAIEAAIEARLSHTVVMVVTPETVGNLREGFQHALDLGVRSIDVNYAIGRRWDDASLGAYLDALEDIVEDHAERLRSAEIELGNLTSRVEPAVLNAEWMVETDGSVHLMTEWALESRRPEGAEDLSFGNVRALGSWDDLYAGRFHAYHALLRTYAWRSGEMRSVLHNNVYAGRIVSRRLADVARILG